MAEIMLRELLEKKDISFRKGAALTGVSKSTLQAMCDGKRDPRFSTLECIAKGLSCKISDFVQSDYI